MSLTAASQSSANEMPLESAVPPANAAARRHMVESQLEPNQVTDPAVIAAMAEVPREVFVAPAFRGVAYLDEDIALGGGRYLMEPMVFARLLQMAETQPGERVLDVGCGTGYGAAVLARMGGRVVALECDGDLAGQAEALLATHGLGRTSLVTGELAEGRAAEAPFGVIVIEGAVERVPEALLGQLADGGRLLAVVRPAAGLGKATLFQRVGDAIVHRPLFDAATPKLPERIAGFRRPASFVF